MICERMCWERGCACYDDRVDKDAVEVRAIDWVDLTEADVEKIKGFYSQASFETIVRAVIAAFKEKNK